jgi:hypothetical protein
MREPNGNPGCLRDSVERVATGTSDMGVRTRSAWVGTGSCGDAGSEDACRRAGGSVGDTVFFSFPLLKGSRAQWIEV